MTFWFFHNFMNQKQLKMPIILYFLITFSFAESLECKRSLKWICDFIIAQCSRPPPAHSKDLHSSIVAAFHCCKTWLLHHPYLLQDKECISTVLEVIEFGISGNSCNTYVSHIVTSQLSKI